MFAYRRGVTSLLCLFLLWSPARAQGQAVGCYAVGYGPEFFAALDGNPAVVDWPVPHRFELRDSANLVSSVPREAVRRRTIFPQVWRQVGRDSITVLWDPGGIGGQTSFDLRVAGDTLRGVADFIPDPIPYFGDEWAKVLAIRTPCNATEAEWRIRLDELEAWGRMQPIDTVLGLPRALKAFQRVKRNDREAGPMYLVYLIQDFYTAHGRFPHTAREAYLDISFLSHFPAGEFLNDPAGVPYQFIPHGRYFDVIDPGHPRRIWRRNHASWKD